MKNKSLTDDLNRIMLVFAIVIGALFSYHFTANIIKAMHIKQAEATIVEVYYDFTYPNEPNTVRYFLDAEFTADGQVYRRTLTVPSAVPLKDGDTLEISYDDQEPERFAAPFSSYRNNIFISALVIAACVFCLVSSKEYFRGYYTDFVLKHKKAVIFTVADVIAEVGVGVIAYMRSNAADLQGFEGMGIAIAGLALEFLCTVALLVVWIVAVVKSAKKYQNEMLAAQ